MPKSTSTEPGNHPAERADREMVWLLGQPQLADYLSFNKSKVVNGDQADARELAAEWRSANDLYYELEQAEAGIADTIACKPLDRRLSRLAGELEANQWFKGSFDNLPYTIELVELDKLVVSQIQIENGFSRQIVARLGVDPTPAALFKFCLPLDKPMPPVTIRRLASNHYEFSSPSSDFRQHEPRLFRGQDIAQLKSPGPAAALFGLTIGFGSNFLSGVRSGSRVLLQNGYHRAYALRSAGITHAWCVVEHVTRKDELRLTAIDTVIADPEFYFASKRPPILRDFFDPRIAKPLTVRQMDCVVDVEIKIRTSTATTW